MKARFAILAAAAVAALAVAGVASADVESLPAPHGSTWSGLTHPHGSSWSGLRPDASRGSRFHAHQAIYPAPTPV